LAARSPRTEPSRARAKRRRARDLAGAALDVAGALVVVLDRRGRIVRFNRACERLTGWRFEDVRGEPCWERLLLPEEAGQVREVFASLAAGHFPNAHENHWVARDGSRNLVAWSNTAVVGSRGEVRLVVGTGVDITQQRRAEAELRRHAARMEALAGAARAFGSGLDYRATLEAVVRLLADTVGDSCLIRVVSEDERRLEPVAFRHRDPARDALIRATQASSPQRVSEGLTGRVLRQGQTLRVPVLTAELIRAEMKPEYWPYLEKVSSLIIVPLKRGGAFGHITMLRDAPGQPYTAEDQAFLEEVAVHAAQSIENARLYELAQAAVAARDEFLSIASHELRTPLTALKLAMQNLRRLTGTRAEYPEALRGTLEAAERQGVRLEKLVAALLDVSRIQAGKLELSLEEVDLAEVVSEALTELREQLADAGSTVTSHVSGTVRGRWDRLRVGQVVTNLLSNAVKYGEGKPIEVALEGDGRSVRFSVRDHGIGLSPEHQGRIFQRFVRVASSRNYGGLGLGLYIARRLAEAHGGSVRTQSAPGQGANFVVELPLGGPTAAGAGAGSATR
jgi:PAS domain S-box-containing protein